MIFENGIIKSVFRINDPLYNKKQTIKYKNKINIYFDSIVIKIKGIKNKTKISKDFVLLYFGDKKEFVR